MADTVTLISANPRRHRRRSRRNPVSKSVLGQTFVLPSIKEAVGGIAGVAAAATAPKIIAMTVGRVGGNMFAAGSNGGIVAAWALNALIGGFARKWVGTEVAVSYVLASSAVHVMQLSHNLTGGKFGLPTSLPSAAIPFALPGGSAGTAGVSLPMPQSLPAVAGARRAGVGGSAMQTRDFEGNQQFVSVT
jgi:hypothetical protein